MNEPKQIELYEEWSAHGHNDSDERWEKHTLSVGAGNIQAVATLTIEDRQQFTPRRGPPDPPAVETTHYAIGVQELVRLIKTHGTPVK